MTAFDLMFYGWIVGVGLTAGLVNWRYPEGGLQISRTWYPVLAGMVCLLWPLFASTVAIAIFVLGIIDLWLRIVLNRRNGSPPVWQWPRR